MELKDLVLRDILLELNSQKSEEEKAYQRMVDQWYENCPSYKEWMGEE